MELIGSLINDYNKELVEQDDQNNCKRYCKIRSEILTTGSKADDDLPKDIRCDLGSSIRSLMENNLAWLTFDMIHFDDEPLIITPPILEIDLDIKRKINKTGQEADWRIGSVDYEGCNRTLKKEVGSQYYHTERRLRSSEIDGRAEFFTFNLPDEDPKITEWSKWPDLDDARTTLIAALKTALATILESKPDSPLEVKHTTSATPAFDQIGQKRLRLEKDSQRFDDDAVGKRTPH
ncbi:hypothetical protein CHUAL_011314 [Chamberlinius hualienensis]